MVSLTWDKNNFMWISKSNKSCMCCTLNLSQEEIISSNKIRDKWGWSLIPAEAEPGSGADSDAEAAKYVINKTGFKSDVVR